MATLPSLDAFRGEDDYEDDSDHSTTMQGPMSGPSRVPTTTEYSLGEDDEVDKLLKQVNNTISTDYSEVEPETLSIPVKIGRYRDLKPSSSPSIHLSTKKGTLFTADKTTRKKPTKQAPGTENPTLKDQDG